jgi:hypothetical protein
MYIDSPCEDTRVAKIGEELLARPLVLVRWGGDRWGERDLWRPARSSGPNAARGVALNIFLKYSSCSSEKGGSAIAKEPTRMIRYSTQ